MARRVAWETFNMHGRWDKKYTVCYLQWRLALEVKLSARNDCRLQMSLIARGFMTYSLFQSRTHLPDGVQSKQWKRQLVSAYWVHYAAFATKARHAGLTKLILLVEKTHRSNIRTIKASHWTKRRADHSNRAICGMNRLPPLEHWDRGFESHSSHGCLCTFILYLCCSVCR
jgi:hypothetical protein